jgi:hypothetical protein
VCYWMCEFVRGREHLEDARQWGRPSDFICHSRIQAAREEMPNESVWQLAEISHYSPSTVFYVLTFVLRLKFRHWKSIPHFLSEDDKKKRVSMAKSLEISLVKAQQRNWRNFWTGDESWIMWDNVPIESWSPLDQEMPQRIRETISAKRLLLTIFQPCWVSYYRCDAPRYYIYCGVFHSANFNATSSA